MGAGETTISEWTCSGGIIQRSICASAVSQEVMASEKTARSLCNINFVDAAG
jgi:hypothetical protein